MEVNSMVDRKTVTFHYDSTPEGLQIHDKVIMTFRDNGVVTNDGRTETLGPRINVLGYAPDGIPLIAAKECLEEMLALVNAAMEAE
jgi:hypothetical protein